VNQTTRSIITDPKPTVTSVDGYPVGNNRIRLKRNNCGEKRIGAEQRKTNL
jgi:hypothetical protein